MTTVLPSAVIPVALAVLANRFWGEARWQHLPFHSLVEAVGSSAAILLALFILLMRRGGQLRPAYVWVASTLMGMGLLDGFHASVAPGQAFVWLHSVATLLGGLTFALVVLPDRVSAWPGLRHAPYLVAVLSVLLGIGSLLYAELIPDMAVGGDFTAAAEFMNMAGGMGFIVAWFRFTFAADIPDRGERLVLANHCLLFGVAGLLFHFSMIWDATWWLWHVLRLIAYLVILWFFLHLFYTNIRRMQADQDALMQRGRELERVRKQLGDIIENSPSLITLKDTLGRYVMVNRRFKEFFGLEREEVAGRTAADLFPASVAAATMAEDLAVIHEGRTREGEETIPLAGQTRTFITARFPLGVQEGGIYGVGSVLTDITARKQAEEALRHSQEDLERAQAMGQIGSWRLDVRRDELTWSKENHRIFGLPTGTSMTYQTFLSRVHPDDREYVDRMWQAALQGEPYDVEHRLLLDGQVKWVRERAELEFDENGRLQGGFGTTQDITGRKRMEEQIRNLAYFDPLTELPNRRMLLDRLDHALAQAKRFGRSLAIMFLDLDDFKAINDTLGHDVGDELLKAVSARLTTCVRTGDTVARQGGDEFIIVLTEIAHADDAVQVAEKILRAGSVPVGVGEHVLNVSTSIGIAVYPVDGTDDALELMKKADASMYAAKAAGGNAYRVHPG